MSSIPCSRPADARRFLLGLLLIGAALSGACATVQPWQRGRLSDSCMVFDADAAQTAFMTHWQESREGAAGGYGVQGGGCACK